MRKKLFELGRLGQPRQDKDLFYRHDKPKRIPYICTLWVPIPSSISTASRGHPSLYCIVSLDSLLVLQAYFSVRIKGTVSRDEYFFWRPKKSNQYFLYMRRWFLNFFASSMSRNVLVKFLLASLEILTNSRYFTGSRIRITPSPHPPTRLEATQREIGSLNSVFEVADNQSSTSYEN